MSDNQDQFGRSLYDATCSECGAACQVPFQPTEGRPVYCRDCFRKHRKPRSGGGGFGGGRGGHGGGHRDRGDDGDY
ncbi:hypothetical protein HY572_01355 [Candidatus Micrarchaeota archaeon]|nr:hypothetical protein [Candidatus Micrarchaeota archaeon]